MSMRDQLSRLVYSTDKGSLCPHCGQTKTDCQCKVAARQQILGDGRVRIRRETKGRKGKGVTLVEGLAMTAPQLAQLAKELKTHCGCGGSVKNATIEIQGDQRQTIQTFLNSRGIQTKIAGA
jgi:translation initiation factor 1